MSVLLHVCGACRHRETSHQGGDRGYSGCPCCRDTGDIDPEPLLVQTWALPGWAIEPLYRPGSQWNAGTTHRLELCDCAGCHARYRELAAEAATASSTTGTNLARSGSSSETA
ncbi:hypothetical protein [Ornithinimicrobium cryptoxanthini]|uniref:RNHCP domain-containing protein n=1 Tax=Ornithinimicrobium cryptoxanthini TaxID=2934161 RepID=A0ABY4YF16_9MICO|nr:hypothetical protein [Ornithinimicrobium cryptoxanthini]USQ75370.1 hypothetical protein NF557_12150 [Ornithinimicrobium cryptoxanthini]